MGKTIKHQGIWYLILDSKNLLIVFISEDNVLGSLKTKNQLLELICVLENIQPRETNHAFLELHPLTFTLSTALFRKVYGTIFQSKRWRLVLKTGVIICIQNYTCLSIYLYFFIKLKHNKNIFCVNLIDRTFG